MAYKNLLIIVPEDLHRKLKVKLAQEGRTWKEFILTVIKLYAEQEIDEKAKTNRPGPGEKSDTS